MSSHHMQSHSDPNYLLQLQNLRIGGEESASRRTHSLNGSVSGIEGLAKDGNGYHHIHQAMQANKHPSNDYNLYDRNNIISASKMSNSKMNDNFVAPQAPPKNPHAAGSRSSYIVNNSPTHSLSGSSQHSGSPRASLITGAGGPISAHLLYEQRMGVAPVYENIDSMTRNAQPWTTNTQPRIVTIPNNYGSTTALAQPQVVHHHHPSQPSQVAQHLMYAAAAGHYGGGGGASYDSGYRKAEPQVSNSSAVGRFAHTPQPPDCNESAPIYENVLSVTGKTDILYVFFFSSDSRSEYQS